MLSTMLQSLTEHIIPIEETDLDDAYIRVHVQLNVASNCITITDKIALLRLRIDFGKLLYPGKYTGISEEKIKLRNELILVPSQDPQNLDSPHKESTTL